MTQGPAFAVVGNPVDTLGVSIGYRIIELFSAGLYSSPNKAVEELISNSYDANARRVDLLLPAAFTVEDAAIWVVDDGHGMDLSGLADLWKIAESKKRDIASPDRPLIGKFGIGKLATYVLASDLTYISRRGGRTLAVTMRYGDIQPDQKADEQKLSLDVRELSQEDLELALAPMRVLGGGEEVSRSLLNGIASRGSWTVVAMSDLKPLAQELKAGRLRWILQNALPNSEDFQLHINGERILSRIEVEDPLFSWELGSDPVSVAAGEIGAQIVVDVLGTQPGESERYSSSLEDDNIYVRLPEIAGAIRGRVEIYRDSLAVGRLAEYGRSHGIFVRVRDRLVNLSDPLFGLPALSHSTFVRWRLVINVDGLDQLLATTREDVRQGPAIDALRDYLRSQFNLARRLYEGWLEARKIEGELGTKISRTPRALSRRPLFTAIKRAVNGEIEGLVLTDVPKGMTPPQREEFFERLEHDLDSDDGLISAVTPSPLGVQQFIARYLPQTRTVLVNSLHPFYSNYVEESKDDESFRLLAATEILTEAYMLEEGISPSVVRQILLRRDEFLRELVASKRRSAAAIAEYLQQSADNEKALEQALHEAMDSLGYSVQRLAQSGKPEGVASAVVGVRDEPGTRADYKIIYDAKSTGNSAVSAEHVAVSRLGRFRDDHNAQYALVVAPDFQGFRKMDGALNKEIAKDFKNGGRVTPMRVTQLAVLVQLAVRKRLGYTQLRDLFETCRTVDEVTDWLRVQLEMEEEQAPLKAILEVIIELQSAEHDTDRVEVGSVRTALSLTRKINIKRAELVDHLQALKRLTGTYIFLDTDASVVSVDTSVDKVLAELGKYQKTIDKNLDNLDYLTAFLDPPDLPSPDDSGEGGEGAAPVAARKSSTRRQQQPRRQVRGSGRRRR